MRSLLVVPGADGDALRAGLRSGTDALILDLTAGPDARRTAAGCLAGLGEGPHPHILVRVHTLATGLVDADLDAVMPGAPHGIVLPDAAGAPDLQQLGAKLAVREAEHDLVDGTTRILAQVDTARALLAVGTLPGGSPRLAGIAWDEAGLARDLGAREVRDEEGRYAAPLAQARAMTLIAAAAGRVPALDSAADLTDLDVLARRWAASRRDGFAGRIVTEASQIAVIHAAVMG